MRVGWLGDWTDVDCLDVSLDVDGSDGSPDVDWLRDLIGNGLHGAWLGFDCLGPRLGDGWLKTWLSDFFLLGIADWSLISGF